MRKRPLPGPFLKYPSSFDFSKEIHKYDEFVKNRVRKEGESNMAEKEVTCAVPGCDNTLTEEQKAKKTVVCSSCEAAKMHLCEACGKKIVPERIRDGATVCKECELNPSGLGETEGEMLEYEPEDFMV